MQLHVRHGAAGDGAREGVEDDLPMAVERDLVRLVERQVHGAREQPFDPQIAAD